MALGEGCRNTNRGQPAPEGLEGPTRSGFSLTRHRYPEVALEFEDRHSSLGERNVWHFSWLTPGFRNQNHAGARPFHFPLDVLSSEREDLTVVPDGRQ